jgi:hypothetical protein
MPNWCENTLIVTGKTKEVKRFKEFAYSYDKDNNTDCVLDHEKFIPYPQKFKDMDKEEAHKSFNLGKDKDKDESDLMVDGLNGYDWCLSNYGTKWGICSPHILKEEKVAYEIDFDEAKVNDIDDISTIVYTFETAWSPCEPIICKMAQMFPNLTFEYEYAEMGNDYEGEQTYQNGELVFNDTRPYTHTCDECEIKDTSVEYNDNKETYLCKRCRMSDVERLVYDKLNSQENNDNAT